MDVEAVVRHVEQRFAVVELTEKPGSCGRCDEPGGCRSAQLTRFFGDSCRTYKLPNTINARPGERVIVRIGDGLPLKAALVVYLLPVVLLILGAVAGIALGADATRDAAAFAGAAGGLAVAVGIAAAFQRRHSAAGSLQPTLARLRAQK